MVESSAAGKEGLTKKQLRSVLSMNVSVYSAEGKFEIIFGGGAAFVGAKMQKLPLIVYSVSSSAFVTVSTVASVTLKGPT